MRSSALAVILLAHLGCTSVSSYGVSTSPDRVAPRVGPVLVFAAHEAPAGATELGVVEAKGPGEGATVDVLFPELVKRAQELGADAVIIDWMGMSVEEVQTVVHVNALQPCGGIIQCSRLEPVVQVQPVAHVRIRGRALKLPPEAPP